MPPRHKRDKSIYQRYDLSFIRATFIYAFDIMNLFADIIDLVCPT